MVTRAQHNWTPARTPGPRWRARVISATLALAGAFALGAATTPAAADISHAGCLWASAGYRQGGTIYAGGWAFTCGTDGFGGARWDRTSATGRQGSVYSPGAGNPVGQFSPGALQPGTDYNDYCVGNQLIEGPDDVYELFPVAGILLWHSAGPVSQWAFDSPVIRPARTWRSSSMCTDGVLS
ncbi:hypothetical protein [Nocardia sp. NBC_01327]|uniref:hypothetical protein n=1 Tax=Nocardia sp. NBC_01327 TaxID=2903593 RepID=UPI002E0EF9C0|nr:hypothetical protein OG326_41955 [Nocardia sp. NBC_01327]